MKPVYFCILTFLLSFSTVVHAQSPCDAVSVEVIAPQWQTGQYSYFGVRVSLSQTYSQDVTVSGFIWDGPDEHGYNEDHPYTLTIPAGSLSAETSVDFYQTGPAAEGAANITSVSPCPDFNQVQTSGNHLKFGSITTYEQYADNLLDRSILSTLSGQSSDVTTMEELDPNDEDTLYPDFLKQILNADHIVEMGSFFVKVDLENHRVLAINSGTFNAYQTLVNNNLSAQGLINLDDEVCNGTEILIEIENGTLSASNYQTAVETSDTYAYRPEALTPQLVFKDDALSSYKTGMGGLSLPYVDNPADKETITPFGCRHARKHTDEDNGPNGHVWSTATGGSCPDQTISYYIEPVVTYQKAVIYFALKAKIESLIVITCGDDKVDSYSAHLKIEGTAKFVKRCGSEQTVTAGRDQTADYSKLKWKPYQSSRSLSKYDFQVIFDINHPENVSGNYISSRTYHIVDGY